MKRTFLVGAVIATAMLGSAAQVGATPGVGGCGAGYMELQEDAALDLINWDPYTDDEEVAIRESVRTFVDANGDGVLCAQRFAANPGQDRKFGFDDYEIIKLSDNKAQGR